MRLESKWKSFDKRDRLNKICMHTFSIGITYMFDPFEQIEKVSRFTVHMMFKQLQYTLNNNVVYC